MIIRAHIWLIQERIHTYTSYNVDRRLNYCRATERLTVSVSDDAVNWEQVAHKEVEEEQPVHSMFLN